MVRNPEDRFSRESAQINHLTTEEEIRCVFDDNLKIILPNLHKTYVVSAQKIPLDKAILMSTLNIGFYEEIHKQNYTIIIIKYEPHTLSLLLLGHRKLIFRFSSCPPLRKGGRLTFFICKKKL